MNYPDNIGTSAGDPASPLYDGRHERGLGAVREEAREAWARDIQPTVDGLCAAIRAVPWGYARDSIHDAAVKWLDDYGWVNIGDYALLPHQDAWCNQMRELVQAAKEALAAAYAEGSE